MNRQKKYKMQSCFRCYSGPNFGGDDRAPCSDSKLDFETFPPQPCPGGIRSNILYPTYVLKTYPFNVGREQSTNLVIAAGTVRISIRQTTKTTSRTRQADPQTSSPQETAHRLTLSRSHS